MIRRADGAFRAFGRVNMEDGLAIGGALGVSRWTPGGTLLDPVTLFAGSTSDRCEVLGLTIGALLTVGFADDGGVINPFGKFGRIIGGMTGAGSPTHSGQGFGGNWIAPIQPLPRDLSLTGDLWNPAVDPMPPIYDQQSVAADNWDVPTRGLAVGLALTLSSPIRVPRGDGLLVGLWMEPSLVSNANVAALYAAKIRIYDAVWSLVYDDGHR